MPMDNFQPAAVIDRQRKSHTRIRCTEPSGFIHLSKHGYRQSRAPAQDAEAKILPHDLGPLELTTQARIVAVQMPDLSRGRVGLRSTFLGRERRAVGGGDLLAPARQHRGVDPLATQERPELAARLALVRLGQQRSLLARGELPPPRGRDDLRVGATLARGRHGRSP